MILLSKQAEYDTSLRNWELFYWWHEALRMVNQQAFAVQKAFANTTLALEGLQGTSAYSQQAISS